MTVVASAVVAEGLGFPEGPLVVDGEVLFVQQYRGTISSFAHGKVRDVAVVGGSPNGLARSGSQLYVTQNGGRVADWECDHPVAPSIQTVDLRTGRVETAITTLDDGRPLRRPNDVCVGPDGAVWFTDPANSGQAEDGWICRWSAGRVEQILNTGPTYPNGIAMDRVGRVIWAETNTHRILALDGNGAVSVVADLGDEGLADGFALARDGTMVVATVYSGGLHVVAPGADGERAVQFVDWHGCVGTVACNCAFDGSTLWVADATTRWDDPAGSGRLWRLETTWDGAVL